MSMLHVNRLPAQVVYCSSQEATTEDCEARVVMARKQTNKHCAFPACVSRMIAAQHEMINDLRKGRSGQREELWGSAAEDKSIHTQSAVAALPGNRERPTFIFSSVSRNLFLVGWAHRGLFLALSRSQPCPEEIMKNIAICLSEERAVAVLFTFDRGNNFYEFRIASALMGFHHLAGCENACEWRRVEKIIWGEGFELCL